jgi:hypothetical protein
MSILPCEMSISTCERTASPLTCRRLVGRRRVPEQSRWFEYDWHPRRHLVRNIRLNDGKKPAIYWVGAFRENPLGQNVNCSDEVTFDCLVDAMTGKSHLSYCTNAERLKLDRGQNSARTFASASVPPLGINCALTFWCRNPNWSLLRGLNQ